MIRSSPISLFLFYFFPPPTVSMNTSWVREAKKFDLRTIKKITVFHLVSSASSTPFVLQTKGTHGARKGLLFFFD